MLGRGVLVSRALIAGEHRDQQCGFQCSAEAEVKGSIPLDGALRLGTARRAVKSDLHQTFAERDGSPIGSAHWSAAAGTRDFACRCRAIA
jgi:hypothetical protein